MTLELALEYIEDDELVEVTPKAIRLRKMLPEGERPQEVRPAEGSGSDVSQEWAFPTCDISHIG